LGRVSETPATALLDSLLCRRRATVAPSVTPRSLVSVPDAVSEPVIRPTPTDDEAAAIVAAVDALWPRNVHATDPIAPERRTSWRFSGRWWSEPTPVRRDRPYL
jgi:hypothetical protein